LAFRIPPSSQASGFNWQNAKLAYCPPNPVAKDRPNDAATCTNHNASNITRARLTNPLKTSKCHAQIQYVHQTARFFHEGKSLILSLVSATPASSWIQTSTKDNPISRKAATINTVWLIAKTLDIGLLEVSAEKLFAHTNLIGVPLAITGA
jgi:hypothetical protein